MQTCEHPPNMVKSQRRMRYDIAIQILRLEQVVEARTVQRKTKI